jgi:choline/glycine/proline betaine transport protein
VREFIFAVLIVPTLIGFAWLTVFGGAALNIEIFGAGGLVGELALGAEHALFALLGKFPFAFWTSVLATVVIVTFFVTSSDSGSLVIDIIAAGGEPNPPVGQRVFWATMEGVVAAVLLVGGGLAALQTASITTGLPFAAVLLLTCWALSRWFGEEDRFRV